MPKGSCGLRVYRALAFSRAVEYSPRLIRLCSQTEILTPRTESVMLASVVRWAQDGNAQEYLREIEHLRASRPTQEGLRNGVHVETM